MTASMSAVAVVMSGCGSVGGFTGAAAGIVTGAATGNPAIGIGVGVAVRSATDAGMAKVFRDMQRAEQDQVAQAAGQMAVGESRLWSVHHRFSYNDARGEVTVLRNIDNALSACKEVAVSVEGGKKDAITWQWFTTQVCQHSNGAWQWAAAEPAVERWGSLH
jgi:hypothetical protein